MFNNSKFRSTTIIASNIFETCNSLQPPLLYRQSRDEEKSRKNLKRARVEFNQTHLLYLIEIFGAMRKHVNHILHLVEKIWFSHNISKYMGLFHIIDYLYDTNYVKPSAAEPVYTISDNKNEAELRMKQIMCFLNYVNHLKSKSKKYSKLGFWLSITQC